MNDWHIQSRAHACQACGKAFADRQGYHTVLFENPAGFVRQDVCGPCWKAQRSQGVPERKGFISHWQGLYEAPPAAPPEAIRKESAETLLRKLISRGDSRYAPAVYILAAMLERKRVLKVKESFCRDGTRGTVYEHPGTGEVLVVTDPELHLNQLQQVQHDVADLLEHGLPEDRVQTPQTLPLPLDDVPPEAAPAPAAPVAQEQESPAPTEAPPPEPTGAP